MVDKNISEKYQKYTPLQLVLAKPDMWIGSTAVNDWENQWVYNEELNKMEMRKLTYSYALFHIYREILMNAVDHSTRPKTGVSEIRVAMNSRKMIVKNNGKGIDVVIHPEVGVYVPEMLFTHFATSSNYSDTNRHGVGTHGIGCKAVTTFSKWCKLITVDVVRKLKYTQIYKDNLNIIEPPVIEEYSGESFTQIEFEPDFARFHCDSFCDSIKLMVHKSLVDLAMQTPITYYFNGRRIKINNFNDYINLFIPETEPRVIYTFGLSKDPNWQYAICRNVLEDIEGFVQISFVNGMPTVKGGKHVKYIADQIVDGLVEIANKGKSKLKLKDTDIRNQIMLFLVSRIKNPKFPNQIKDELSNNKNDFGSEHTVPPPLIGKIAKLDIIESARSIADFKEKKKLEKTDGKKKSNIGFIDKLEDANKAGTRESNKCTLILTEGDSAKTSVMSAIGKIGRDYYGVFPLRGKLINVRDKSPVQINENKEIQNIKKILGLRQGEKYTSVDELRYGKIMILTDADNDGAHIKGLIMNFIHNYWKTLIVSCDFITCMATPIIKATRRNQTLEFYSQSEYNTWKIENENASGGNASGGNWKIDYFKGLATSGKKEFESYFEKPRIINYKWNDEVDEKSIQLAFNKSLANDRKDWLKEYDPDAIIDYSNTEATYTDFVKLELKHFSNADNIRSIPSVCDGLKPSTRKIIFAAFKRNLVEKLRVAQFAGYISEATCYHHGEASLQGAIIGLAQTHVGSNNIALLEPIGQFGTRLQGGKDHGSARYIHTRLGNDTLKIFNKLDFPLYKYLDDDGTSIEPVYYVPILPMILINGQEGIGTGYSTFIPNYSPTDIIANLRAKLNGEEMIPMHPSYNGFKGKIVENENEKGYTTYGTFKRNGKSTEITITELPIGVWTDDYKKFLGETLQEKKIIKKFVSHCSDCEILFKIESVNNLPEDDDEIYKLFKLTSSLSTNNMHAYNRNNVIQKYNSPLEIINEFYEIRLEFYQKRKDYMMASIEHDIKYTSAKARFIEMVIARTIIIEKRPIVDIEADLITNEYPKLNDSYEYLIGMPIRVLTKEKIDELNNKLMKLKEEYNTLKEKNSKMLWIEDLYMV